MNEREETHDFMSVDSFSQLPFIRRRNPPSPPIRLFGFDFPPHASDAISNTSSYPSSGGSEANTGSTSASASASATKGCAKKFECQYCFRNFPTSQALGGHQNAHKRERQHAKRAYLAESHLNHQLCSHGRLGLPTVSAARFTFDHPRPPPHYPSWSLFSSGMAGGDGSFYSSASRPINSTPILGLWRSQTAPPQLSLLRGEDGRTVAGGGAGSWPSPPYASAWPREWHGREAKDGVISLDLHL